MVIHTKHWSALAAFSIKYISAKGVNRKQSVLLKLFHLKVLELLPGIREFVFSIYLFSSSGSVWVFLEVNHIPRNLRQRVTPRVEYNFHSGIQHVHMCSCIQRSCNVCHLFISVILWPGSLYHMWHVKCNFTDLM